MGLTGSEKEIQKVALQFGAAYLKQTVDSNLKYIYAHTDYVYLIDPKGELRGYYRTEKDLEQMVFDMNLLLQGK